MNISEISSDDLKAKMDAKEDFILIDLIGEKSYESLHLPRAVYVAGGDGFVSRVDELVGSDRKRTIILYGLNFRDELSTRRAEELTVAGFTNVLDFKGGLKDWAAELYPLEGKRAPK